MRSRCLCSGANGSWANLYAFPNLYCVGAMPSEVGRALEVLVHFERGGGRGDEGLEEVLGMVTWENLEKRKA